APPPDRVQPVRAALRDQAACWLHQRLGGQRYPEVRRIGTKHVAVEGRRRDADDRRGNTVDGDGLSDGGRRRRESLLPRAIAHDRDRDRKSTRLNSSHEWISYAVFCLKKKKKTN